MTQATAAEAAKFIQQNNFLLRFVLTSVEQRKTQQQLTSIESVVVRVSCFC